MHILFLSLLMSNQSFVGQTTKAILEFKDGTILNGLGKLKGKEFVKFKKNSQTKAIKYHFKDLESVIIFGNPGKIKYVYLYVIEENKYKVLKESIVGKISLYETIDYGQYTGLGFGGLNSNGGIGMGTSFTIENYYLLKDGEKKVNHLGSTDLLSKNFEKAASEYFKDCPELVEKIQLKEYKIKDIQAVVNYYNNNCKKI